MATFTVHVPSGIGDPLRRADRTLFVREGFSWPAFLFGPLFLVYRRLWLAALAWVATAALLGVVCRFLALPPGTAAALVGLLSLFTGFEANEMRRNALARRGYLPTALIAGRTREGAERVFFEAVSQPYAEPARQARRAPARGDAGAGDVIGLFPEPGGAG